MAPPTPPNWRSVLFLDRGREVSRAGVAAPRQPGTPPPLLAPRLRYRVRVAGAGHSSRACNPEAASVRVAVLRQAGRRNVLQISHCLKAQALPPAAAATSGTKPCAGRPAASEPALGARQSSSTSKGATGHFGPTAEGGGVVECGKSPFGSTKRFWWGQIPDRQRGPRYQPNIWWWVYNPGHQRGALDQEA